MATKYFLAVNVLRYLCRLVFYLMYCACWSCACVLDYLLDRLMSVFGESATGTAQLGRILWKKRFSDFSVASPMDFMCMFRSQVKLEYILRPTVSLYAITKKNAIFVETPEGVNIHSSDIHPFHMAAQFLYATKVIKMTISDFVRLAEKIGDPKVHVIWMSNTGRCGGTMVCQVFESVPGSLAIHEPDPPFSVQKLKESNAIQDSEYEILLKAMLRILCKPRPGISRICIKPRPQCSVMLTSINKLGIEIRHLFIYRNSLDTLRSWLALLSYDPFPTILRLCTDAEWFSNIFPYIRNILREYLKSDLPANATTACVFTHMWAHQIYLARNAMLRGQTIMPMKYEDMLSQPTKIVEQLFEHSGIDTGYVVSAVATLSRGSQRGSVISRENLADTSHRYLSEKDRIKCDAILTQFNLPRLGEDFRFEQYL